MQGVSVGAAPEGKGDRRVLAREIAPEFGVWMATALASANVMPWRELTNVTIGGACLLARCKTIILDAPPCPCR